MLAVAGLVVLDQAVPWVAERVWWIGGTVAAAFVLSVAASMWLERWQDRRGVAWGAARGIYSRADYIAPPRVRAEVLDGGRPGIAPHVTINIYGQLDAEQAAAVRRAIGGTIEP